ncbi:mitogen-activated protein kinase-binding protein 1 isoform X3, partial [Silurus meridionalis]
MEDLEEEEEEALRKTSEICCFVPETPDQEAFLKKNFANLSDFSTSGGPTSPLQPTITDSVSISSKFLNGSTGCRQAFVSLSKKNPESKVANELVHPPVFEVHPLMEDRKQSAPQELQKLKRPSVLYLSPEKKRIPVEISADSLAASAGMRKAQSIHSISADADMPQASTRLSEEIPPHSPERAPPSTPRRTIASVPLSSPTSSQPRDCPTPTKSKSRSYMSPTTSSIAKMSRSMSMGDNLNMSGLSEVPTALDTNRSSGSDASNLRNACRSKPSSPIVPLPSSSIGSPPRGAILPTISGASTPNSSSKGIQAKLPSSIRPQLHLDISKPLPDKPSMASFSPNSKNTKLGHKEDLGNRTPVHVLPLPGPEQSHSSSIQPITYSVPTETRQPEEQELNIEESKEPEKIQGKDTDLEETQVKQSNENQGTTVCMQASSQAQDSDASLSMESCRLAASELQNSFKKACHFYRMLNSSTDQRQEHQNMTQVLTEAFEAVQAELNLLPYDKESSSSSSSVCVLGSGAGGVGEERTLALLEQYSQLLLRAVEKRMDSKV